MSVAATLEPTGRAERVAPVRVGGRCPGRWAGWCQHEAWLDLLSPVAENRIQVDRAAWPAMLDPTRQPAAVHPGRRQPDSAAWSGACRGCSLGIELAVPTATVGDGLAIGNTRWLAPDLLDELEPGTRSGRRSGCRVRDDVGAADV